MTQSKKISKYEQPRRAPLYKPIVKKPVTSTIPPPPKVVQMPKKTFKEDLNVKRPFVQHLKEQKPKNNNMVTKSLDIKTWGQHPESGIKDYPTQLSKYRAAMRARKVTCVRRFS